MITDELKAAFAECGNDDVVTFARIALERGGGDILRDALKKHVALTADALPPTICLADVEIETVSWLWKQRIPLGKLTLLDGDPGVGKSTLTADIAARVSTGAAFPECNTANAPGAVLFVAVEDGVADTIKPRLDAAGADVSRIHHLPGIPSETGYVRPIMFPDDADTLERLIEELGITLVVVDSLMASLAPSIKSFSDQDVRRALTPLVRVAEKTGAAIVVIRHLNKAAGGTALYRGGGSIGIVGVARSGLLVAKHPDDENTRILAQSKSNLGTLAPSLAFSLASDCQDTPAHVKWGDTVSMTADALVDVPVSGDERTASSDAEAFLRDLLAEGEVEASAVLRDAKTHGMNDKTLRRAADKIGVVKRKEGFGTAGRWVWEMPRQSHDRQS